MIALLAAFGRLVCWVFLLLLLLLLLLPLLWLVVLDICNIRGHGLIKEFVQGVKSAASGHHRSNCVLERVAEACPGNIVDLYFHPACLQSAFTRFT